jgi:8-oxo-dGTP pyrophosphatase MutT (NUDIX family)
VSAAANEVLLDGIRHRVSGAQAAIFLDGRVLVQLRPWPPGWELPGGHVGADEDPAACIVREVLEETGLQVRIRALVGVYRWAGLRRQADAVFLVVPVGGQVRRSIEAIRMRWVDSASLPRAIFPWCPIRISDALAVAAGGDPVLRTQPVMVRHVLFFGSRWVAVVVDAVRGAAQRLKAR